MHYGRTHGMKVPGSRRSLLVQPGHPPRQAGFSLIELLIVVAIISILASIAVPNFQEAVVRSKTAKFMGDTKAVETAIEAFHADHGKYPPEDRYPPYSTVSNWSVEATYPAAGFLSRNLTTPVAYISKLPIDPFPNNNPAYRSTEFPERRPYNYSNDMQNADIYPGSTNQYYVSWTYEGTVNPDGVSINTHERPNAAVWMICSPGPDADRDHGVNSQWRNTSGEQLIDSTRTNDPIVYDPTNGTLSDGDLYLFGPGLGFPGE